MKILKIKPEYQCSPLWIEEDNKIAANINLSEINLDNEIKDRLQRWAEEFDLTLNQDYPPDSKFKTVQDEINFENEGLAIWELLKKYHAKEYEAIIYKSVVH